MDDNCPTSIFVQDYLTRLALNKLGCTLEVDAIDAQYLSAVHGEFAKLQQKELEEMRKKAEKEAQAQRQKGARGGRR